MKWMIDLDAKLAVADAIGRALDLLGLPRYAALCRSETTRAIINAYEYSTAEGKLAFRRADAAAGIQPPDLPELSGVRQWGFQEASARSSAADFLELAIAGGDLVPGTRGWKSRQQELVRNRRALSMLSVGGHWSDRSLWAHLDRQGDRARIAVS